MTATRMTPEAALWHLRRPLRLTRAGMVAERAARAFWPLWSVMAFALGLLSFGVQDHLPQAGLSVAAGAVAALALGTLAWGLRRFRWPTAAAARDRLDRTLAGRPIAALTDRQAIGAADPASAAVWRAHVVRMAERAAGARAPAPDLRLAAHDRFALRYVALGALTMALLFGSLTRVASVRDALLPGGGGTALALGPAWEGWIEPPVHTGLPTLYLNEIAAGAVSVPVQSRVTLRLYGELGALSVAETVSGRASPPESAEAAQSFDVARDGTLRIDGDGGREWLLSAQPDVRPEIAFDGDFERIAGGRARQDFAARDDYGVTMAQARIALDLGALERRFGLAAAPEPRAPIVIDLPLPVGGGRADLAESLIEDFSQHPWANLPVSVTLTATDAAGQTGTAARAAVILPGRRFFEPLAAALIEMRRDLLWSAANGPRVAQVLRAVSNLPEGLFRDEGAYLQLRVAIRRLESGLPGGLAPEMRDEIAAALWVIATKVEDGDLASALDRLRRAQDRLSEAIRDGADPAEIADLMAELRAAMDAYIRQLAENAEPGDTRQQAEAGAARELTQDQLQQMLRQLQELMEQGRMTEAEALLEQLRQMMENLQVTQGGPGQQGAGQQGAGQQAMRELADALRQQQGLSDDTFRNLQESFGGSGPGPDGVPLPGAPGQQPGNRGAQSPEGAQPGGEGAGAGDGPGTPEALAERQRALRELLRERQESGLPYAGTEAGEGAASSLDDAGRAMDRAERALREEDLGSALDAQSEALEALRDSLRELGEALAEGGQGGSGYPGGAFGDTDPGNAADPLGRNAGQFGRLGTDGNLLQGEDVYRRAQDLLDEIRRRSGEAARPEAERDYLRRLLDRF